MSQGGNGRNSSGSGGSGITEITGNTGSTTGPIVNFTTNLGAGVTSSFTVAGTTATLNLSLTSGSSPLSVVRQVFTTTSVPTYTPTTGMQYCLVELVGGGGGAAGSDANNVNPLFVSAGTGGGSGGYCNGVFSAATIGASQSVIIGLGGAGLAASGTGNNGTSTSFGTLMNAGGGSGGFSAAPTFFVNVVTGGTGGTSTGGDYGIVGQAGGQALGFSMTTPTGVPGAGSFFTAQSFQGGSNPLGFGGNSISVLDAGQTGANGLSGTGYGSGGSSAASVYNVSSAALPGGNGANGIAIITEYVQTGSSSVSNWVVVTSNTTMNVNTGYIANAPSVINLTMPATAAVGSIIEVCGINPAGGWSVVLSTGQSVIYGTSTAVTSITSTNSSDTLRMVCTIANSEFVVLSGDGNPTIV